MPPFPPLDKKKAQLRRVVVSQKRIPTLNRHFLPWLCHCYHHPDPTLQLSLPPFKMSVKFSLLFLPLLGLFSFLYSLKVLTFLVRTWLPVATEIFQQKKMVSYKIKHSIAAHNFFLNRNLKNLLKLLFYYIKNIVYYL